ncbi:glycosyltransferase [Cronobacter malonaticus]
MKLLINASNLYVGGGVQVAVSVLEELSDSAFDFIAVVSPVVYSQLSKNASLNCIVIRSTPSKLLNFKVRKQLDEIVIKNDITVVFTIFGPSYWSPKNVKHAIGFALPWLIYDTSSIVKKLHIKARLKFSILKFLQPYYFKKNADLIFTETDDVNQRVTKLLGFDKDKVHTVSNTLNGLFTNSESYDYSILDKLPEKKNNDIWLVTISHNYPHKNLEVIGELVKILPSHYKFVLTVSSDFLQLIPKEYRDQVITIGNVSINQCAPLYEASDGLFMPTLLECFSASYLEAMYMKKVIFTSDLPFAHTVCKDAAFYFCPNDIKSISDNIINGFLNKEVLAHKVSMGSAIYEQFPSAKARALQYMDIIKSNLR